MNKRTYGVERLYTLGDYKNLKVTDYLEVPQDFPEDAMDYVRYYQLISLDLVYEKYVDLGRKQKLLSEDEKVSFLLEERANTVEKINEILNKGE